MDKWETYVALPYYFALGAFLFLGYRLYKASKEQMK